MCGICGIVHFDKTPVREDNIRLMMKTMKHRGPDDEGVFGGEGIGLGFVRLSIIDLSSAGNQPMSDDSGRYYIIHNGEVYNYLEIKEILKKAGFSFRSKTDTEVILKSYIYWGESCLDRFNGMWAFAIFDKTENTLFISRDRYGIKPLYYYLDDHRIIFASEIRPILSILNQRAYSLSPSPDYQSIFDYLVFNRTDHTEQTFYKGIKKIPHGHLMKIKLNQGNGHSTLTRNVETTNNRLVEIQRWYDLKEKIKRSDGFVDFQEYKQTFSNAIGLRLRSDVPIGVCLSGGLDSSSIVSILLNKFQKNDLNTFSAVYQSGQTGDETKYIKEFASSLKYMFYTKPTGDSLFSDLNTFVQAHSEPVPSTSPYAQFKVMELAKNNVVVTLDGQGADEELAGYHYFFGFYFKELLKQFHLIRLFSEMYHYLIQHNSIFGMKIFAYLLLPSKLRTSTRVKEKTYINEEFINAYKASNQVSENIYGSVSLNNASLDHFEHKLEHLLKWEDSNSMWFSLEARVPFLDHNLVEKTLATDSSMIIKKGTTKYILREAMKGTLPEKIRIRNDKIGFETPADEWFRSEKFQSLIFPLFQNGFFFNEQILDPVQARKRYELHLKGKINIHKEIWKWINLDLWHRYFIK
ncbi:asparagine synthase (glutamine-hydrolyzing) [Bacteroidota bacterium]